MHLPAAFDMSQAIRILDYCLLVGKCNQGRACSCLSRACARQGSIVYASTLVANYLMLSSFSVGLAVATGILRADHDVISLHGWE
jgi:hypothetical protein